MVNRRSLTDANVCILPHYHKDPNQVIDPDLIKLQEAYRASLLVNLWITQPLDFETLIEKDEYDVVLPDDTDMASFLKRHVTSVDQILAKIKRLDTVQLNPRLRIFLQTIKSKMDAQGRIAVRDTPAILEAFHASCQTIENQRAFTAERSGIRRRSESVDAVFHKRKCKPQDPAEFFGLAYPKEELPCKYGLHEGANLLRRAFTTYRRGVNSKKLSFANFPGRVYMQYHFTPAMGTHWSIGYCGIEREEMEDLKALLLEVWTAVYPTGKLLTPHLTDRSVASAKDYLVSCMRYKTLITPMLPEKTHTIVRTTH